MPGTSFSFFHFCCSKNSAENEIGENHMVIGLGSKPDAEEFPSLALQSSVESLKKYVILRCRAAESFTFY